MKLLKESLLLEITLQDHFDQYFNPKYPDWNYDAYNALAKSDPTSSDNRKGKYVDWIIKTLVTSDGDWDVNQAYMQDVKRELTKFMRKPKDINQFKSYQELKDYTDTIPDESNKELKKKKKDIFNSPDDIKMLKVDDEWIVFQTLTREGNIMGAQWSTNPQANWCTAYLDRDNFWRDYSRKGDLIQIINKDNPYKKYQVFIQNGKIIEEKDYKDHTSSVAYKILDNDEFEENYGSSIEKRPPFKYTFDEEGTALRLLSDNFENEYEYLNRQPDEDEYDYYMEEANENEEFQINHWDRFLKYCYEIFEKESDGEYSDVENRMEYLPNSFKNPITGDETDKTPAKDAVYDMYTDFEEEYKEYVDEYRNDAPSDPDQLSDWEFKQKEDFLYDNDKRWSFIQYFLKDFPYEFDWGTEIDNSDQQLSFNYESVMKLLRGTVL